MTSFCPGIPAVNALAVSSAVGMYFINWACSVQNAMSLIANAKSRILTEHMQYGMPDPLRLSIQKKL